MIPQNIFKTLKKNHQFKEFIKNIEDFEILIKKLNLNEIQRLSLEYPDLLKLKIDDQAIKAQKKFPSIFCITLIKKNFNVNNYMKINKIKVYLDELNEKIIKILHN
ncbi:MAG: hypothetical protein ACFFAN_03330 [Promethearchaeota archaeon]